MNFDLGITRFKFAWTVQGALPLGYFAVLSWPYLRNVANINFTLYLTFNGDAGRVEVLCGTLFSVM